jgi:hypothetical protein
MFPIDPFLGEGTFLIAAHSQVNFTTVSKSSNTTDEMAAFRSQGALLKAKQHRAHGAKDGADEDTGVQHWITREGTGKRKRQSNYGARAEDLLVLMAISDHRIWIRGG